ncbi:MAG: PKD domain-containing protein, partial [Sphingobacteriales bacterium]
MLKRLVVFTILLCFLCLSEVFGQITIMSLDPGPYTPGSSISAIFSVSGASNIRPGNKFDLYLSDSNGSFAGNLKIGTFDGFYSTFVNGVIPAGTVAGTGYLLQVRSTAPVIVSANSDPFEIKAGAALEARLYNRNFLNPSMPELFGFCSGRNNFNFNLENESTTGTTVSASITNELNGAIMPVINFNVSAKTFTAQQAHYTIFVKALAANGTVATRGYMIVNNRAITAFGTAGTNDVCLGGDALEFNVLVDGNDGIGNNFPGTTYRVDWGDNTNRIYTLKDIKANGNKVGHSYTGTACGNRIDLGSTAVYNAFGISIFAQNQYCGVVGTPISTFAKVSIRPVNNFVVPVVSCSDDAVVFVNTSTIGENPEANGPNCVPNLATFTWYVDGDVVPGAIDKPKSFNLNYLFTPGTHTVTLESTSNAACSPAPVTYTVCVQRPPVPSFTLNGSIASISLCNSSILTPVNTSVVDNSCVTNTYTWSITGGTYALQNGTTLASAQPQIRFTGTGEYKIKLTVNTSKCGAVTTSEQVVLVSATPTASLSPNTVLCNYGTFNFSAATGPTRTLLNGTPDVAIVAGTYSWEVTGGDYEFVNGTTANTKYPRIQFKEFKTYTIQVTHTNNCSTVSATQIIEFRSAPVMEAGNYTAICYDGTVQLNAADLPGQFPAWVGGAGTFSPNRSARNAVYTPSSEERDAGQVDLRWQITTSLAAPCNVVYDIASIDIRPKNILTSIATKSICSGSGVAYAPVSAVAGSTYTWAVISSSNVSGVVNSGTGNIGTVLSTTSAASNGTITYRIIPRAGGCDGVPFELVVTITPRPVVTANAAKLSICTGEAISIPVSNNLPAAYQVKYIYTSTVSTAEISGNTANATAPATLTEITDILVNAGVASGTVTYRITPVSETGCSGTTRTIVITVNPQGTIASAGADETICSNISYQLEANIPDGTSTGRWTTVGGPAVTFADATKYNTAVTGLQGGQTYTFRWTITTTAGCATFDDVIITNLPQVGNINITAGAAPVCKGQEVTISGTLPTGGDGNYQYSWEVSNNNGASWILMPGEIGKDLVVNINETTSYRRITRGGICVLASNTIKVVMLDPIGNNTITASQNICLGDNALALRGSTPTGGDGIYLYQWQQSVDAGISWTNVQDATSAGFAPPVLAVNTSYRRIVKTTVCTGYAELISNVVLITIKPHARAELIYQLREACAPFAIDAINLKAVPYSDRNDDYTWYVNDVLLGRGINFPGYIINTDRTTVTIKLVVTSRLGCTQAETTQTFNTFENVRTSFTADRPSGCGPRLVNFRNTSNITQGVSFRWDFGNGVTSEEANPGAISFLQDPTGRDREYTVTLNASNACGNSMVFTEKIIVRTQPVSIFSPGSTLGCSPVAVSFVNTSPESTGTSYTYDFGDGSAPQTFNNKSTVTHSFSALGTTKFYTVKMTAKNECGEHTSQHTISIAPNNIFAELVVDAGKQQGCAPLSVEFANNSGEATSYSYDFGDGTPPFISNTAPEKIKHTFTTAGVYIVTLTAVNNCVSATTTETITVFAQPTAGFTVDKLEGYPGLKFNFTNTSLNGVNYLWDFGDGTTSTEKDAVHSFVDLGTYAITLRASNVQNCPAVFSTNIAITGEPGALVLANAFIPGSDNLEFREFKAKGTGILSWKMSVFDKWGTVVWETTKLNDGKPVDGWDGTFK